MYTKDMIESIILYAMLFVGTPYKWGGNNPMEGFDCSGFVLEALRGGLDHSLGDMSAQSIYKHFKATGLRSGLGSGALLFFGRSAEHISHVAIALDHKTMIEAGGGGNGTLTKEDAIRHNAFVRIRPIRKDLVGAMLPWDTKEDMAIVPK